VLLPLGVGLAKGTMLSVDKAAPRKLPYLACWRRGCSIELTVPSLLERRLRIGKNLTVTAFAVKGAKPLHFRFSLKGLGRAIRRLRSK
jgi:invasion protein IalB